MNERTALRTLSAAALAVAFGASGLLAQDANNDAKSMAVDTEVAESVDILSTAAALAAYGHEFQSPEMLVAAAKLVMQSPPSGMMSLEDGEAEGGGDGGTKAGNPVELDAAALLAAAASMTTDANLRSVIEGLQGQAGQSKGATTGAGSVSRRIDARSTRNFWIRDLRGGQYARIDVRGDGDTDLDCWLYDENGNLVASDTDYTDWCILEVRPRWTGPFRIRVSNLGSVWNGAVISWN